jgi:hypothetical protein
MNELEHQIGVIVLGEGMNEQAFIDRTIEDNIKRDKYGARIPGNELIFKRVGDSHIEIWQEGK